MMLSPYVKLGGCHKLDWHPVPRTLTARISERKQLAKADGWEGLSFSPLALSWGRAGYGPHAETRNLKDLLIPGKVYLELLYIW